MFCVCKEKRRIKYRQNHHQLSNLRSISSLSILGNEVPNSCRTGTAYARDFETNNGGCRALHMRSKRNQKHCCTLCRWYVFAIRCCDRDVTAASRKLKPEAFHEKIAISNQRSLADEYKSKTELKMRKNHC